MVAAPVLSLADLERFDSRAPERGGGERRFCCPLCGTEKPVDATHRSLSVNLATGEYLCHRCHAQGKLRDRWEPQGRRERDRAHLRRAFAIPPEEPPAPDPAWRERLRGLVALAGTAGETYLAGRGIPLELAHAAGVRWQPDWFGRPAVLFPLRGARGDLRGAHGRYTDNGSVKSRSYPAGHSGVFWTPGAAGADPLAITEAPIDALSLALAGLPALALAGTSWPAWLARACAFKRLLIATDADEPGDAAARRLAGTLGALAARCARLRPDGTKDWNETLVAGGADALRVAVAPMTGPQMGEVGSERCACGAEVSVYGPDGMPYCERCLQGRSEVVL